MKILFYLTKPNYRYESLLEPMRQSGQVVGFVVGELSKEDFRNFNPDVVIHDIPNADRFPTEGKFISINLNETNSPNSFSILGGQNFLEPFVVPQKDVDHGHKYKSKLLYIGDPTVFGDKLPQLIQRNLKVFHNVPIPILGYSGSCGNDYYKFYKHAEISIVHKSNDLYRIRDIIVNRGTPIVYDDMDDFIERVDSRQPSTLESRELILKNHTNYDRASFIFKRVGLDKMSKLIIQAKAKI